MPAAAHDPAQQVTDPVPEHGHRRRTGEPVSPRPRLVSDGARYALSVVVTVVLAAVYGALAPDAGPGSVGTLGFVARVYFGAWSVYSLVYAGLTWAVLHRVDGEQLARWLTEDRSARRRRRRTEWLAGSAGPLGAVSFCAIAIGAVIGASLLAGLREDPVVIVLAVLVVAASWLLILTVYSVHYARENVHRGGLEFRGIDHDGPPRLADHTYLAVQVATAYNGADVIATSRAMRRTITAHAVVAFVFNSVLVALLVSLLITVTT